MEPFNAYSAYYDLLYRDKDYRAEVNYVRHLIDQYHAAARTVLELGCGTGIHASLLQQRGLHVTGIDRSADMLKIARSRLNGSDLKFLEGDILSFRDQQQYDIVLSLFHVMSYMSDKEMLLKAFNTASAQLAPDGVFIFDCWHGPGVLADPPHSRSRQFENEQVSVSRVSVPEWIREKNLVNVRFQIEVSEKQSGRSSTFEELHPMRYWFEEEVKALLDEAGLSLLNAQEWMSGRTLDTASWNACYIARKNKT